MTAFQIAMTCEALNVTILQTGTFQKSWFKQPNPKNQPNTTHKTARTTIKHFRIEHTFKDHKTNNKHQQHMA